MIERIEGIDEKVREIVEAATSVYGEPLSEIHKNHFDWPVVSGHILAAVGWRLRELIESLCGPDDYVQASPNLRIHRSNEETAIPFHSDVLYGHSPRETNYWLALTPALGANSLWVCGEEDSANLHDIALRPNRDLQKAAITCARPVIAETPGLYTFCCSQLHGSVRNTTGKTRVSFDIRTIPCDAPVGVKRRGSYFKPKWLKTLPPYIVGPIPSVATLDYSTPVYLQRSVIRAFCSAANLNDLVEFHGLNEHAPTLEDAMRKGACVAYTVRQLRRMQKLDHPIGFADEKTWFNPGDEEKLERFWRECR